MELVIPLVIEENPGLDQTGVEPAFFMVIALTMIGGGLALAMEARRRRSF
jgi:hypothetical protein